MAVIKRKYFEISHNNEAISFGPRGLGDLGRDILAVKAALGEIVPAQEVGQDASEMSDSGWFDCSTGNPLNPSEGATFDKRMQRSLMKFQLENQYYILEYLFQKYSVNRILDAVAEVQKGETDYWFEEAGPGTETTDKMAEAINMAKEVQAIISLFESEFGYLGEATLSVLNGWLPITSNTTSPEGTFDVVRDEATGSQHLWYLTPINLWSMLKDKTIGPDWQASSTIFNLHTIQEIIDHSSYSYEEIYRDLRESFFPRSGLSPDWFKLILSPTGQRSQFERSGLPDYGFVQFARRPEDYQSPLNTAVRLITESFPIPADHPELETLSAEAQAEMLMRAFEPEIKNNPDPYEVGLTKIKFFLKTDYTFENLPPSPNTEEYDASLREMADEALHQVLQHYERPDVWYISEASGKVITQYFSRPWPPEEDSDRARPEVGAGRHDGSLTDSETWVLTLQKLIDNGTVSSDAAKHFSYIEGFNNKAPLIKFVEFRTPSLRPGDTYRAEFVINKNKFDLIEKGMRTSGDYSASEGSVDLGARLDEVEEDLAKFSCAENAMSDEEQRRRYAEFRSIASKKKKEIVRNLRAMVLERQETAGRQHEISIQGNLGPFGELDVTNKNFNALDVAGLVGPAVLSNSESAHNSLTEDLLGKANIAQSRKQGSPVLLEWNTIKVGIPKVSKALRDAASDVSSEEWVDTKGNPLNPPIDMATEASKYDAIMDELDQLFKIIGNKSIARRNDQVQFLLGGFKSNSLIHMEDDFKFDFTDVKSEDQTIILGRKLTKIEYVSYLRPQFTCAIGPEELDLHTKEMNSLSSPRTMGYFEQHEAMAGMGIGSMADPLKSTCADVFYSKPGVAFAMRYTYPKLEPKPKKPGPDPVEEWARTQFMDPFEDWVATSAEGLGDRSWKTGFLEDENKSYNSAEILPMIGEACTLEQLYGEFLDKYNLFSLLCDWLKCLRLPGFSLQMPNFHIPPIPELPTFGWMSFLRGMTEDIIMQIIRRALCTLVRGLMDILTFPFCSDDLHNDMFGAAGIPDIAQKALADALTDLGLPRGEMQAAGEMVSDASNFLTPRELCHLLQGKPMPSDVYDVVINLIESRGYGTDGNLSNSLNTEDKVKYFFESLGVFVDSDLCSSLEQYNHVLGEYTCKNASDMLKQIRDRLKRGGVPEGKIEEALDLAQKNMMDKSKAMELMASSADMSAILPPVFKPGDPAAVISELPHALKYSAMEAAKGIFDPAKMAYIGSLKNYVPAMTISVPGVVEKCDDNYDAESTIVVERNLERLRIFAKLTEQSPLAVEDLDAHHPRYVTPNPRARIATWYDLINVLYLDFETRYELCGPRRVKVHSKRTETGAANEFTSRLDGVIPYPSMNLRLGAPVDSRSLSAWRSQTNTEFTYYEYDQRDIQMGTNTPQEARFPFQRVTADSFLSFGSLDLSMAIDVGRKRTRKDPGDDDKREVYIKANESEPLSKISTYKQLIRCMESIDVWRRLSRNSALSQRSKNRDLAAAQLKILKLAFLQKIGDRMMELQKEVADNIEKVTSVAQKAELFGVLRGLYDQSLENAREQNPTAAGEMTSFAGTGDGQPGVYDTFTIKMPNELSNSTPYVKIKEFPGYYDKDPYVIEVGNSLHFNGVPQRFQYCDPVDPRHTDELTERFKGPEKQFTKRAVFSTMWTQAIQDTLARAGENQRLSDYTNVNLSDWSAGIEIEGAPYYQRSIEGIFEQNLGSVYRSRIFENDYVAELERRVSGLSFFDPIGGQCVKNKYNLSHYGLLSFDDLIFKEFPDELSKELARPENAPEMTDYTKPGPTEKAIQNVALRGFIRVCLIEMLLKGGLVYPVWDMEPVISDPFFIDYLTRVVKFQIENNQMFSKNEEELLSCLRRLAADRNAEKTDLIRHIVNIEAMRMPDLSKRVFDNRNNIDYSNYFLSGIPHYDVSGEIGWSGQILWNRRNKLLEYNDPYLIMESYVRLTARNPEDPHLADLSSLIGFGGAQIADVLRSSGVYRTFDNITRGLQMPSLASYDFDILDYGGFSNQDRDDIRQTEMVNINELHRVIRSVVIPSGDYKRFIDDLKGYFYYEEGRDYSQSDAVVITLHPLDGAPIAIENQPGRFIRRKRRKFKIAQQIFDPESTTGSNVLLKSDLISEFQSGIFPSPMPEGDEESFQSYIDVAFSQIVDSPGWAENSPYKYYVVPVDGALLIEKPSRGFKGNPYSDDANLGDGTFDYNYKIFRQGAEQSMRLEGEVYDYVYEQYSSIYGHEYGPQKYDIHNNAGHRQVMDPGVKMGPVLLRQRRWDEDRRETVTTIDEESSLPLDPDAPWFNSQRARDRITFTGRGNLFMNNYGEMDRAQWEAISGNENRNHKREDWVETVVDFTGTRSIIYKMPGETFDPLLVSGVTGASLPTTPNTAVGQLESLTNSPNVLLPATLEEQYSFQCGDEFQANGHIVSPEYRETFKRLTKYLSTHELISMILPYRGDFGCFHGPHNHVSHGLYDAGDAVLSPVPSRPMGFVLDISAKRGYLSGRATLEEEPTFRNNPVHPQGRAMFVWDRVKNNTSKELGYNEYRIPTRLLITQIKRAARSVVDTSYMKFVLPRSITFDFYTEQSAPGDPRRSPTDKARLAEGGWGLSERYQLMQRALVRIFNQYMEDVDAAYFKIASHRNDQSVIDEIGEDIIRADNWTFNEELAADPKWRMRVVRKYCPDFPVFVRQENMERFNYSDYSEIRGQESKNSRILENEIVTAANDRSYDASWDLGSDYYDTANGRWLEMKDRIVDQDAGHENVEFHGWRDAEKEIYNCMHEYNDLRPAYCSIAKIYSTMCDIEAEEGIGNFDDTLLDRMFGQDPGFLIKRDNLGENIDYASIVDQANPDNANNIGNRFARGAQTGDNVEGVETGSDVATGLFVGKWDAILSNTTGLYQWDLHSEINQHSVLSISNLILWFKQRRREGFWGRTFDFKKYAKQKIGLMVSYSRGGKIDGFALTNRYIGGTDSAMPDLNYNPDEYAADSPENSQEKFSGTKLFGTIGDATTPYSFHLQSYAPKLGGYIQYIPVQADIPNPGILCGASPILADGRCSLPELYRAIESVMKTAVEEKTLLGKTRSMIQRESTDGVDSLTMGEKRSIMQDGQGIMFRALVELGLGPRTADLKASNGGYDMAHTFGLPQRVTQARPDMKMIDFMTEVMWKYFRYLPIRTQKQHDFTGRDQLQIPGLDKFYYTYANDLFSAHDSWAMNNSYDEAVTETSSEERTVPIFEMVYVLKHSHRNRQPGSGGYGTDETHEWRAVKVRDEVVTITNTTATFRSLKEGALPYSQPPLELSNLAIRAFKDQANREISTRGMLRYWIPDVRYERYKHEDTITSTRSFNLGLGSALEQTIDTDTTTAIFEIDSRIANMTNFYRLAKYTYAKNHCYDPKLTLMGQSWISRGSDQFSTLSESVPTVVHNRFQNWSSFVFDDLLKTTSWQSYCYMKYGAMSYDRAAAATVQNEGDDLSVWRDHEVSRDAAVAAGIAHVEATISAERDSNPGRLDQILVEGDGGFSWTISAPPVDEFGEAQEVSVGLSDQQLETLLEADPDYLRYLFANDFSESKNLDSAVQSLLGHPFRWDNSRWKTYALGTGRNNRSSLLIPDGGFASERSPIFSRGTKLVTLPFSTYRFMEDLYGNYTDSTGGKNLYRFSSPMDAKRLFNVGSHSGENLEDEIMKSSHGSISTTNQPIRDGGNDPFGLEYVAFEGEETVVPLGVYIQPGSVTYTAGLPSAMVDLLPGWTSMTRSRDENAILDTGSRRMVTSGPSLDERLMFSMHENLDKYDFGSRKTAEYPRWSQLNCISNAMIREWGPNLRVRWDQVLSDLGITSALNTAHTEYKDLQSGRIRNVYDNTEVRMGIRLNHVTPLNSRFSESDPSDHVKEFFRQINLREEDAGVVDLISPENETIMSAFSLPMVHYEEEIILEGCLDLMKIKDRFNESREYMKWKLQQEEDFKTMVDYVFPLKRYMSAMTVFSTDVLSMYGDMPSVMSSPKSALSVIFSTMANRNDFNKNNALENIDAQNLINSELFNQQMQNMSAQGPGLECFDIPGLPKDFWKMIWEQIKQFLKYFPSMILRGIADNIDPAYKEMKHHWFECDMDSFSFWDGGVFRLITDGTFTGDKHKVLRLGMDEDWEDKTANYVPVNFAFPIDLISSIWALFPRLIGGEDDRAKSLGRTLDKFITYIYSGNLPMLDPNFAFAIPCIDASVATDWGKFEFGKHGRYGHSMTPFTLMAMMTPNLPGDKNQRKALCQVRDEEDGSREACPEESPTVRDRKQYAGQIERTNRKTAGPMGPVNY